MSVPKVCECNNNTKRSCVASLDASGEPEMWDTPRGSRPKRLPGKRQHFREKLKTRNVEKGNGITKCEVLTRCKLCGIEWWQETMYMSF
jgi:hypothetical protein